MDSNVTQLALSDRILAWADAHKKQVVWGILVVLAVALAVTIVVVNQRHTREKANTELAKTVGHGMVQAEKPNMGEDLLKLAEKYPSTPSGERALLFGAAELFKKGDYAGAHAQFEKFIREHRESPFINQAFLGAAASLDAQGKTNEAVMAYETIVNRRSPDNTIPQAQFALARIYEARGDLRKAIELYETVRRSIPNGQLGDEAGIRFQELAVKHPELLPRPEQPPTTPSLQSQPQAQPQLESVTPTQPQPQALPGTNSTR